jgi:hypothetical protein
MTPRNVQDLEDQTKYLNDQLEGHFFRGEDLLPFAHYMFKFVAKGSLSIAYNYEMQLEQLTNVLARNQKRASISKDRKIAKNERLLV